MQFMCTAIEYFYSIGDLFPSAKIVVYVFDIVSIHLEYKYIYSESYKYWLVKFYESYSEVKNKIRDHKNANFAWYVL